VSLRALFFDFDGTIAETERDGHRVAYQAAFDELGLGWNWDEALYGKLLAVAGGKERLESFVRDYGAPLPAGASETEAIARIHERKRRRFAEIAPHIPLRPGVARLVLEAKAAGLRLAVVTTAAPEGVEALLAQRPDVLAAFDLIAGGDVVPKKKPAPDIYAYALARLDIGAADAFAIEDSAIGLRAATAAGVRALVTRSWYTGEEDFDSATAVLDDLGEPDGAAHVVRGPSPANGYVDLGYVRALAGA
jgi:HAD superfamily hydrolase (TIGR01509 family)